MGETNYSSVLCENIVALRKKSGLTQEALADRLGITFQAVSKWENGQSCPDISLLPQIAGIFGVSIDGLFGIRVSAEREVFHVESVPWDDDNIVRAVVYRGRNVILRPAEEAEHFVFEYRGAATDVVSYLPLQCGNIFGDVTAKGSVVCENVEGDVRTDGPVTCADVEGDVRAGSVSCENVGGDVEADILKCRQVDGDVNIKKMEAYEEARQTER